jgi:tetratricopeptide (TPR) repeat protein
VDPAALASADAAVLRGCYDCLLAARDVYERAAAGPNRAEVLRRLFETYLLIALREREFELPDSGAENRARVLAAELPSDIEAPRYLALLARVPPEHGTWMRQQLRDFRAANRDFSQGVSQEISWLASGTLADPVRRYMAMTLLCAYPPARATPGSIPAIALPGPQAPPLVRYRSQACSGRSAEEIASLLSDVPEFAEMQYFAAINAVAAIPAGGGPDPRPFIAAAAARFPDAIAVTYLDARLHQSIGRCDAAIPLFDRVIAVRAAHEDAWLGRVMCLTDLGRREDAVAAATHIMDAKFDNASDALYWRAFNRHQLGQLDLARADVGILRARSVTAQILQLAGIIEHDQHDLGPAEADLKWVVARGSTYCTARWYLGSVHVQKKEWAQASALFESALGCFMADADARSMLLGEVKNHESLDAEYKQAQIAELERQIGVSRRQAHAAALNAAKFLAATGDLKRAGDLLVATEGDDTLAAEIDELRAWLEAASRRAGTP